MTVATVMTVKAYSAILREFTFVDARFVVVEVEVLRRCRLVSLMHVSDRLTDLSQKGNKHQNYESKSKHHYL